MPTRRNAVVLCLIRCGETEWDLQGRVQGSGDLPLSEAGRARVVQDAHRLDMVRASLVYHPSDEAAAATAQLCARRIGARTKNVPELADPHLGLLEGLTEQDFEERFPSRHRQWEEDPISLSPPDGEDFSAAADRLYQSVAKILRRSRSGEVAIVLHNWGLAILRCWLADRPLHELRAMLGERPRVERYAVPMDMIGALATAAAAARLTATGP